LLGVRFSAPYDIREPPLVFHFLFRREATLGSVVSVSFLPGEGSIIFEIIVHGVRCRIKIGRALEQQEFLTDGTWYDSDEGWEQFGLAYDTCLAYIIENTEEVRRLGFDTSELSVTKGTFLASKKRVRRAYRVLPSRAARVERRVSSADECGGDRDVGAWVRR
jgi:hypothetical protein